MRWESNNLLRWLPGVPAALCLIAVLMLSHCASPEAEAITYQLQKERQEKDAFFASAADSPLLPEDRRDFAGLHYYPVDLSWRFEGPIVRYDSLVSDTILGTRGDRRPAVKYGYFEFSRGARKYRLQIYRMPPTDSLSSGYLFLGFTDKSSGTETYGGGRYVDLKQLYDDIYVVDFNTAYNPYCAYNPAYSCAIPPAENYLDLPVRAGEKQFKVH